MNACISYKAVCFYHEFSPSMFVQLWFCTSVVKGTIYDTVIIMWYIPLQDFKSREILSKNLSIALLNKSKSRADLKETCCCAP